MSLPPRTLALWLLVGRQRNMLYTSVLEKHALFFLSSTVFLIRVPHFSNFLAIFVTPDGQECKA